MMKRSVYAILLAFAILSASQALCFGADMDTYGKVYGAGDFKMNQDGSKLEVPTEGGYMVTPRMKRSEVWTRFEVPADARQLLEWIVTASAVASTGASPGVALIGDEVAYSLSIAADGKGALRRYEEKKVAWSGEFAIENFSYPAELTIHRDKNGSVEARVNGVILALDLRPYAVGRPNAPAITHVAFATASPTGTGSATYEKLNVSANGKIDIEDLFKTDKRLEAAE